MTATVITENKGSVNMRANPSKTATILAQIPYLTVINYEKENDAWSKVTYNNKTGYVMTKFLSIQQKAITRSDLERIYNSLKSTLSTIENILK